MNEKYFEMRRLREGQEAELEKKAHVFHQTLEISGLILANLEDIERRGREGLDSGVYPHFSESKGGVLVHNGYGFSRAEKRHDLRTLWQKIRRQTNTTFTDYMTADITYAHYYRRAFCGDGHSFKIISDEYGTNGRTENGNRFERHLEGPAVSSELSQEELLRICMEFALQRYTENPNIRVSFKDSKNGVEE